MWGKGAGLSTFLAPTIVGLFFMTLGAKDVFILLCCFLHYVRS
jgi:hypothetical protein